MFMPKFPFKSALSLLSAALLSACSLVKYQPVAGIDTVDLQRGYRFETSRLQHNDEDDTLIVFDVLRWRYARGSLGLWRVGAAS